MTLPVYCYMVVCCIQQMSAALLSTCIVCACADVTSKVHLYVSLSYIAHICELHHVLPAANDTPHLAGSGLLGHGGEEEEVPRAKNSTGPESTCGQSALGAISIQDELLSLDLQEQGVMTLVAV